MPESLSLDFATTYIAYGLAVFPLRARDKRPITEHGVKDATKDGGKAHRWFVMSRDANIAIATGRVSNVVVLDVDGDEGLESLRELLRQNDAKMPKTPTASTGRGMHIYFKHPGEAIKNGAGTLPGLDVRGDGGYVVAPPSVHPSGEAYEWLVPLTEAPFAPVPDYLMAALFKPADRPGPTPTGGIVPAGRRNDTAFKDASGMRRRGMGTAAILAALRADNGTRYIPPLDDEELERIVASAERYAPDTEALKDEEWQRRQLEKRDAGKPEISLRVTVSNPKTWHLTIGSGNTIKLSTEQLLSWPKVKAAHLEQLMAVPSWEPGTVTTGAKGRPRSEWPDIIAELVPTAEKIDAPDELTTRGRVLEFVRIFCARRATSPEALTRGSVYFNAEAGELVFRTGDMIRTIERDFGLAKNLSAREVNEVLREHFDGKVKTQRVGKSFVRVMSLPAERIGITAADDETELEDAEA